tara:strand:- start:58 stop:939 length:882 start_codon:yes stop_codon:yes gene_type:complete
MGLGTKIDEKTKRQVIPHFFQCCNYTGNHFPGSMAISMERKDIPLIKKSNYWFCEKSDGVRYILFATMFSFQNTSRKTVFLVDRALNFYIVKMCLPLESYQGTIIDGELVDDCFHIFDCICIAGKYVGHSPHSSRMSSCRKLVDAVNHEESSFQVVVKKFVPLNAIQNYMNANTFENNDGFIFTPEDDPVQYGTHSTLFKLKSGHDHTVDFVIDSEGQCFVTENKKPKWITTIPLSGDWKEELSVPKVVECSFMNGTWKILKRRTDKKHSNSLKTYQKTLLNMKENILLCELY